MREAGLPIKYAAAGLGEFIFRGGLRSGLRIPMPPRVQDWAWDFDNRCNVKPFSFTLTVPQEVRS